MIARISILNQLALQMRADEVAFENTRSLQQHEINLVNARESGDMAGVEIALRGIERCQHVARLINRKAA